MDGIINIYKEKGYTSHDVVAVVRRTLKQKKVGHTGTLDPLAEGVLPICVGKATRLADYIMNGVKGYRANITFGVTTDTQDAGGVVLERRPVSATRAEVEECVRSFAGSYDQIPPMYSAIKVGGQRLYKLAREGEIVERKPRRVEIFEISVRKFISDTEAVIDVVCGKGTYIRALCADIGEKLGCGAYMSDLLRTRSGEFGIDDAIMLGRLHELAQEGRLEQCIIPPAHVLRQYKSVKVKGIAEKLLINGNKLRLDQITGKFRQEGQKPAEGECVVVYSNADVPVALYRYDDGFLKSEIML
ncbi:MAG: tRNA pseudouridine(55) synthase TruB [Defluviitaleaceae bacterium]|nr:tRNA pseudouridine(55) synthase TruB [Defluviitaleaceae bacterium]